MCRLSIKSQLPLDCEITGQGAISIAVQRTKIRQETCMVRARADLTRLERNDEACLLESLLLLVLDETNLRHGHTNGGLSSSHRVGVGVGTRLQSSAQLDTIGSLPLESTVRSRTENVLDRAIGGVGDGRLEVLSRVRGSSITVVGHVRNVLIATVMEELRL